MGRKIGLRRAMKEVAEEAAEPEPDDGAVTWRLFVGAAVVAAALLIGPRLKGKQRSA